VASEADWAGAVLTGGASRRMGRNKSEIEVDGVAMAVRVAQALLDAGAATVGRIGDEVPDLHPGEGPLGGALTALAWSDAPITVVAPCDLVAPDPAAFRSLVDALLAGEHLVAVASPDQPLPLALRAAVAAGLAERFGAGERSLRSALAALPTTTAALPPGALADADTPEELPPGAR
jgi:molybdopterin-guanine dinucleotide biosynthesis protein A